jgi:hypothetical protein
VAEPAFCSHQYEGDATRTKRFKTGAQTPATKPHPERAEFFALPIGTFGSAPFCRSITIINHSLALVLHSPAQPDDGGSEAALHDWR